MYRKLIPFVAIALIVIGIQIKANAYDRYSLWGGDWSLESTWNMGLAPNPDGSDNVGVSNRVSTDPSLYDTYPLVIGPGCNALCKVFWTGVEAEHYYIKVKLTGGTFSALGQNPQGMAAALGYTGYDNTIWEQTAGSAYFAGTVYIPYWDSAPGTIVYINGGTFTVKDNIVMHPTKNGLIDIGNGTFIIENTDTLYIDNLIGNGQIVAFGGRGALNVVRDLVADTTTVTATFNPAKAWNAWPAHGQADVPFDSDLSWSPGEFAISHKVYFGDSLYSVENANTSSPEYKGTQPIDANSYDPSLLELGQTYYWRIDEVNSEGTEKGYIWSFTVQPSLIIDNFESYIDGAALKAVWHDGSVAGNDSGSLIYLDIDQSHKDFNSLKMHYDNTGADSNPYYSEIVRTPSISDFTAMAKSLDVWYLGNVTNSAESIYINLSDGTNSTTVVNPNPNGAQSSYWRLWRIDLKEFTDINSNLNLANISKISIGLGNKDNPVQGGQGTVYFDDIALFPSTCMGFGPESDLNGDCKVNFIDWSIFANGWLETSLWP